MIFFKHRKRIVLLYRVYGLSSAYSRKYRALLFSGAFHATLSLEKFFSFFFWLIVQHLSSKVWIPFNFDLSKKWQLCVKEQWCRARIGWITLYIIPNLTYYSLRVVAVHDQTDADSRVVLRRFVKRIYSLFICFTIKIYNVISYIKIYTTYMQRNLITSCKIIMNPLVS